MAQGLASPVMAYLSLSLSISSAPEHSSGLRAVGRWGGGRGSRCHGALGEGRCPVTSSRTEGVRGSGGSCNDRSTVHRGYHQRTSRHTPTLFFYLKHTLSHTQFKYDLIMWFIFLSTNYVT